jgi:opacity protein-like surface antigen
MMKKMLLLVGAAMALVAFSASAAQANQWYTDDVPGGEETLVGSTTASGDHLTLEGELATTNAAGTFRSGPCETEATVTLWNENGQATGEVTTFNIFGPCGTSVPGCNINEAITTTEFPWHIDVVGDAINITGAGFANKYNDGCTGLGIPPGVPLGGKGTATGEFNTTSHCIEFNRGGDLVGPLGEVFIDGEVCNVSGNTLTLK